MKLEEATILALQGKLLENKLDENDNVKEDLDEENSLDDIANYIKGIVDYNVTITPTGGGFSSYDVNFLYDDDDDSIMYSVAVNDFAINDKVMLLNTLIIGLDRFYRGKTFADIIRGKLLDELNKIHPVNKKVTEATKLEETDATPEFMGDLKNLINNYMRVDKIASIELQHRDESDDEIVVITFENGGVVRENVTGDSNLAMARSILFRLA